MIVSFDFDGTLSRSEIQKIAKEIKALGHRTCIITNRYAASNNDIVYRVAKEVGIKDHHVWFCDMLGKNRFIRPAMMIDVHIDDDFIERELIEHDCEITTLDSQDPDLREKLHLILNQK
jgi:FMN phosphatase YigB (HAD superfamily)